jgi:hypothetical protein
MSKKSTKSTTVQHTLSTLPRRTPAELEKLARLASESDNRIDTTDMPDASLLDGGWVRAGDRRRNLRSLVHSAVEAEMRRRGLTRYELWKLARLQCPTLPDSAVYEFLAGTRQIGLVYVEALLAALDLNVTPRQKAG